MSRSTVDPVTGLTPKQEAFCLELAKTGNASEAYRRAYNASRMKPETVARTAHELAQSPKIAARLSTIRQDARKQTGITLAEHLKDLKVLRNMATQARQFGPAVSAETARGKASGLYDGELEEGDSAAPVQVNIRIVDGRKDA